MANTDRNVRRHLLKPLSRRSQRVLDSNAYVEALRRLDERALGENELRQLHHVLSSLGENRSKEWKDPVRVRERVALARALYASRRISRQQYVFYAVAPVETLHDARFFDGDYDAQLGPVQSAIDKIEKDHGLGPDEYWPRGTGPKEHRRLNRQYEAILVGKFEETLAEFGLDDVLAIMHRSPEEFEQLRERGRRSVFHNKEYVLAIQDIVVQYEQDARRAAKAGAFSAAVTSLGAGVEGLLLLRCLRSPQKASSVANTLPKRLRPRPQSEPSTWTFETLIETCDKADWLKPVGTTIATYDTASMAHVLRHMRNYVHPGRHARERPWSVTDEQEYRDADAIYVLLQSILGKVRDRQVGVVVSQAESTANSDESIEAE